MTEDELAALQQQSVDVMAAAENDRGAGFSEKDAAAAVAVVLAVPALCDEVRFYYGQAIAAQRRMEGLEAENNRLYRALAFAASVIKSGESWTTTCDEVIGGALRHEP
jgi:hypothetical protein